MSAFSPSLLPHLRRDLLFTPVREGGKTFYVIEDPIRHLYYRVGREEYLLVCTINQSANVEDLIHRVQAEAGTLFTVEEVQSVLAWLSSRQLLVADEAEALLGIVAQEQAFQGIRRFSRLNLISFKLPLGNPDPLLQRCHFLSAFAGLPFFMLWLILGLGALATLASHWEVFSSQATGFLGVENLARIWLIWFGLKLIHELFHALVCYRYGGRIYEAGVLFILFIPLTYVNATSTWLFPSRWQRMHVAVAGIFIELGIAFVALLIWSWSPDSPTGFIAHNTVIVAGISSLLFNANPLMRFDGYYVLADLTGQPNLYQRGLASINALFANFFLGQPKPQVLPNFFITLYGGGVYCWRILVFVSLGYMASTLAGGLGIFITFGAVLVWLGIPFHRFFKRWPTYRERNPAVAWRLASRLLLVCAVLVAALNLIGWDKRIEAPAVVEFEQQYSVRAKSSGFVSEIRVADGDLVKAGQVLLVLENNDLQHSRRQLLLQLEQLGLKSRLAHSTGRIGDLQILRDQESTMVKELQAVEEDIAALTIVAPGDGICISGNLAALEGTYLARGQDLLLIVSLESKEVVGLAAQNDIDSYRRLIGKPIEVDMRASGIGTFLGRIDRIAPQMSTTLFHPALGAVYGGPLDVRQAVTASQAQGMEQQMRYELFSPRFILYVDIPEEIRPRLAAGQLATLTMRGGWVSLGDSLWERIRTWIKGQEEITAP